MRSNTASFSTEVDPREAIRGCAWREVAELWSRADQTSIAGSSSRWTSGIRYIRRWNDTLGRSEHAPWEGEGRGLPERMASKSAWLEDHKVPRCQPCHPNSFHHPGQLRTNAYGQGHAVLHVRRGARAGHTIVTLSAARGLNPPRDRCFAALSMTLGRKLHSPGVWYVLYKELSVCYEHIICYKSLKRATPSKAEHPSGPKVSPDIVAL